MRGPLSRGRCLASSITILLLSALPAAAQDGYVCGYGKTPREAIADIANGYVLVSTQGLQAGKEHPRDHPDAGHPGSGREGRGSQPRKDLPGDDAPLLERPIWVHLY